MKKLFSLVLVAWILVALSKSSYGEPVDYSFTVHGILRTLPQSSKEPREIIVKHGPIPEYRDSNGTVVGMHAMTMPFYLEEKVTLDGYQVGDEVRLTVEVKTKPAFKERVVFMERTKVK